jgi:xylulose-5-phosphate/fructose-6-phosphate phosphoketolase
VCGDDPVAMHPLMARTLDGVLDRIVAIQAKTRAEGFTERPRWPMIVLRSPKGWAGPNPFDNEHQVETSGFCSDFSAQA